ncbi:MAG TPA: ABC transporter substrate-binding protein [Flavisolibacter sp.]|nr:ABC transporter substrate-binding protein [Flavisolibacter sp.]
MKRYLFGFCFLLAFSFSTVGQTAQRYKIAVFTPLYLDSSFDASGNFRYEKTNFPRHVVPGLEFYEGVQAALDSLEKRGAPLDIFVYDSRGRQSLSQQLARPELRDVDLILAQSNASETKILAAAALQKKVPFISTTLPNDAGIDNNPYFVILNSTLQAHVESIYKFIQKYHGGDRIVVFRKAGAQEDQLKEHFIEFTKTTTSTPLSIKYVDIGTSFTAKSLATHLDSTRRTVCIAGSLDEAFAQNLTQSLAGLAGTYPVRVIGMPTWDNFNYSKLDNLEIIYSTPFYYSRSTPLENRLTEEFSTAYSTKPTDMFFRGYETMLRFAFLLLDTKKDISSNLTRKGNTVFTQFDIQPVFKDKSAMTLDYFENRHLYFIKVFGGVKNILY